MNKAMDSLKAVFRLMIVVVAALFVVGELILPRELTEETYCEPFDVSWKMIREDGSVSDITIPGDYEIERDEKVIVETVLPEDIEPNLYLCFRSNRQDMEIYVGDELRRRYSTDQDRLYGNSSTAVFVFVKIEQGDGGKPLRVSYQTDTEYSGKFRVIYYGDKMGIWKTLFQGRGGELIISILMLLLGGASVVGSLILRLCYRKPLELEYLGWGVFLTACWMIADSIFRQLFFPNITIVNDLAFILVMLITLPFMIYLNEVQKRRYNFFYVIAGVLVTVDAVVCIALQFLDIVDFSDSIAVFAGVSGIGMLLMAITIAADVIRGYIRQYKLVAVGILGATMASVAQLVLYFRRNTGSSSVLIAYGMIFLLVISTINAGRDILHTENEKQKAIYANESKARFLANMSHEIRTPINAVLGMDEMILRESTEQNIREYAADIQSAGKSLLALINDILDFSKIESGKMEIVPVEYELSSLLCDCYNMVVMRAQEKNLALTVENDGTLPNRLYGDEIRVRQVIVNLLTNAVKYTREGSVVLSVQGKRMENSRLLLQISVQDTGIGITEENCAKLFDSFQRVDEEKNRSIEGTGLGLAITRQIVELMQGSISVESEYGKGSVFSVEIPQNIIGDCPIGEFAAGIATSIQEGGQTIEKLSAPAGKVLVVDDVDMNLRVFCGLLKYTQIQIDTALSGREALEMAGDKKYHMIFLDHMMPEMDGVETFHALKQMEAGPNADTPVIMLTANAIVGVREQYLQEGFADYLAKPIQGSQLEAMIRKYLPADCLTDAGISQDVAGQSSESAALTSGFAEKFGFLDVQTGMKYCMDSEEFYLEMLEEYVQSDRTQMMEQCVQQMDWKNYRIQVHSLKSNSLSIGAVELSEHAKAMEMAVKDGHMDYVEQERVNLLNEYKEILQRIKEELSH